MRRTFRVLSLISASIFIFAGILWVRMLTTIDQVVISRMDAGVRRQYMMHYDAYDGFLDASIQRFDFPPPIQLPRYRQRAPDGFQVEAYVVPAGEFRVSLWPPWTFPRMDPRPNLDLLSRGMAVQVRPWVIMASAAVLPGVRAGRALRRRRHRRNGLCRICGYDLRASPETCPECRMKIRPESAI